MRQANAVINIKLIEDEQKEEFEVLKPEVKVKEMKLITDKIKKAFKA